MHTTPLLLLLPRCPGTQISCNWLSALINSRRVACLVNYSRSKVSQSVHAAGYATSAAPDEPGQPTRKERSRQLSSLQRYGRDLTAEARRGLLDPVIGRQDVIQRTLQVLLRRSKHNPLLIGEAGVGKTAIVEGIAQLMAAPQPLRGLAGKRLVALDVASVVAGSTYRGEFEERLQGLLHDCENAAGSVVLFIDEIHVLVGAGNTEGGLDFANMLKPALARSVLQVVGATTLDEYRQHIETDPALTRRFQPILVEEPSAQECLQLLTGLAPRYEAFHSVKFTPQALAAAVGAAQRYIPERRLPDSAIDLIDEAAAKVRLAAHNTPQQQQQQPALDRTAGGGSSSSNWLAGLGSRSSSSSSNLSASNGSSGGASVTRGSVGQDSSLDSSSSGGGGGGGSDVISGSSGSSSSTDFNRAQSDDWTHQHSAKVSNVDSFAAQVQQEVPSITSVVPAAAAAGSSSSTGSVLGSQQQQQERQQLQQQSATTADKSGPSPGSADSSFAAAAAASSSTAAAPASWADWITARGWRGESEVHRQQLLEWFGASPVQPLKGVLGHKQTTHERRKKHAQLFGHQLAADAGQHSRGGSSGGSGSSSSSSGGGGGVRNQPTLEPWKHNNTILHIVSNNNNSNTSTSSTSGGLEVDHSAIVQVTNPSNPSSSHSATNPKNPKPQQDLPALIPEWHAHDHSPRSCPHCGTLVTAPREQLRLQCPDCGFRFLNLAPEKLQLGTTVLLQKQQQQQQPAPQQQQQQQWVLDGSTPVRFEADVILPVINAVASATATVFPKTPDRRATVAVHEQPRHQAQLAAAAAANPAAEKAPYVIDDIPPTDSAGSSTNGTYSVPSTVHSSSSSKDGTPPLRAGSSSSRPPQSAAAAAPRQEVTSDHILEVVSEATGIPLALLSSGLPTATGVVTNTKNNMAAPAFSSSTQAAVQELATIHAALTAAVLGQDAAAAAVVGALRLSRLGLHHNNISSSGSSGVGNILQGGLQEPQQQQQQQQGRLSLSLLLTGPSGVGKSRMAAVLASSLMPGEVHGVLHLSCGELSERHSISRLVGAPPGYVGYGKGGLLTEAIRRRPHSVVVFDDVERAHPDVVGLLLQAVEEGRLMDSLGHSINLRSTTFIFTANTTAHSITFGNAASSTAAGMYSNQQAVQQQQAVQYATSAAAVHSSSSNSRNDSSSCSSSSSSVRSFSTGGWGLEGAELEGDESSPNPSSATTTTTTASGGSSEAVAAAPSNPAAAASAAAATARDAMVAELGSRVDDIIDFQPLNPDTMSAIVQQQLQQAAAAAQQQGVLLYVEDPAAQWLATAGGSKTSGARVLGQLIRRHVMVPLAAYIMEAAAAADGTGSRDSVHGSTTGVAMRAQTRDAAVAAALAAAGDTPGIWAVAVLGTAAGQALELRFEQLQEHGW